MTIKEEGQDFFEELISKGFNTYYVSNQASGKGGGTFTRTPDPLFSPYIWRYKDARNYLSRLSEILSHEDSERINIQYEHPDLRGMVSAASTTTQRAGIQLVKKGAHGPLHRHTPNSFRVVLEAPERGAISRIDGVDLEMHPGDVIGNSNWMWHEHFNNGDSDLVWTSFLDAIFVKWIGGVFYDPASEYDEETGFKGLSKDEYTSVLGRSTLPSEIVGMHNTPLQFYSFSDAHRSVKSLSRLRKNSTDVSIEYRNPTNGGPISANQSLRLHLLPSSLSTPPRRRTENAIVLNYSGECRIDMGNSEKSFEMKSFDVAVLPSWAEYSIVNTSDAEDLLYFVCSDEPLFRKSGLYRESGP